MTTQKPQDRLLYAQSLAIHLDRIGNAAQHLFDVDEDADGKSKLPAKNSRIRSFWGQIQVLESFIYPSLSKNYFVLTKNPKIILEKWTESNEVLFAASQRVLQALMMECQNNNLLFKSMADEEVEEDAEQD